MNRASVVFLVLTALPVVAVAADRPDILVADFEGKTYGDWKTTGEAFGSGPAQGTLPGQMPVDGFEGKGLVNSFFHGDGTIGTLTSPPVRLERKYLNFLLGGGNHPGETCINLKIGGKVVRTASGPNDRPGGSEHLDWQTWDVQEFAGQTATIEIVDGHVGGWGHINVDHVLQSDRKRQTEPARRAIVADQRYLHLPVQNSAPVRRMKVLEGEKTVREFDIQLAEGKADFQAFLDVSPWKGKSLTIMVDRLPAESKALEAIVSSEELPDSAGLYKEPNRPQFHFTARRGWLNDPNGLVRSGNNYHLFFQHNPYGWSWGNMHWGHAVSRDLVHWEELPESLYPREYGDWCFSGSAVLDSDNTTGLKQGDAPVLVAAFTSTGRGECLVYSRDDGRTWTEFPNNPVVKHAGRDPRLLWHPPTKRWVMAVYDEAEGKRWIAFYTSPDMKAWTFRSRIEGFFECPDLFELPVLDTANLSKWILYAADGQYAIGSFDGEKFQTESGKHRLWHGNFYAAQTYSNAPDERRIQIGWGNGIAFPGSPFNQQMTVSCELTLRETPEGPRMHALPVPELETLRDKRQSRKDLALAADKNLFEGIAGELLEIALDVEPLQAKLLSLKLRGLPVVYDVARQELSCRDHRLSIPLQDGRLKLRLLIDRGSIEIFAQDGRSALSAGNLFDPRNDTLASAQDQPIKVRSLDVWTLKSAWTR